jgi:hypothetical protein
MVRIQLQSEEKRDLKRLARIKLFLSTKFLVAVTIVIGIVNFLLFFPAIPIYILGSSFLAFGYGIVLAVVISLMFLLPTAVFAILLKRMKLRENYYILKSFIFNVVAIAGAAFFGAATMVILLLASSLDEKIGYNLYFLMSVVDIGFSFVIFLDLFV